MKRPCIPPAVKRRRNFYIIERRRHIRNNPKDEEQPHPRHPHDHSHVLARQSQRDHAEEVQHPVYQKRAVAIRDRVPVRNVRDLRLGRNGICVRKINLECHGDKRVGEREHEVGTECGEPAPENELPEFERWVALGVNVGHVDGQIEGEAEEGDDD